MFVTVAGRVDGDDELPACPLNQAGQVAAVAKPRNVFPNFIQRHRSIDMKFTFAVVLAASLEIDKLDVLADLQGLQRFWGFR